MKQRCLHFLLCCVAISLSVFAFLCFLDILKPPPENNIFKSSDYIRLNKLKDYNYFIANAPHLPDNFVTAEMLSCLGKFEEILFYDGNDLKTYRYTLEHESGFKIYFYVHEKPRESYKIIPITSLEHNYMDALRSELSGHFDSLKTRYHYTDGDMIWIEWSANGMWYSMNCGLPIGGVFGKLRSTSIADQLAGLEMLPDQIGDADLILFAEPSVYIHLFLFALLIISTIVSWHFVKVKRPVRYKDGMTL